MNNYETVFIVTPVLSDAQVKEVADKFQGVITENGGQIVNSEAWGLKKLAYPIQKKTTGFYFLIESITTSAASAQPVCVPPALQTDTSTPHPAKVPFQQQRMGLIADRMMPQSQTRRNSGQSGRIASASSKS